MSQNPKNILRVYLNNTPVGALKKLSNGALHFQYETTWVNSPNAIPLSLSLPLTTHIYAGDVVINYFDNLLPDNDSIRKTLALRMSLNNQEVFNLLSAIGRDCVGAIQLIPEQEGFPLSKKINALPISDRAISEILKNLKNSPLGINPEEDFRISIAGAQEKTAFLKLKNGWHIPQGSTPSSHIFKVQMGVLRDQIDMTHSVENEWLCLQICKAFGLPTAEAEIADFNGVRALVVERFDRELTENSMLRYAQEDFCQAAGLPSYK
ncbi:MAG: HipA N-terminal domain-containing protein, partial [Bdellovibrionales bacterium]